MSAWHDAKRLKLLKFGLRVEFESRKSGCLEQLRPDSAEYHTVLKQLAGERVVEIHRIRSPWLQHRFEWERKQSKAVVTRVCWHGTRDRWARKIAVEGFRLECAQEGGLLGRGAYVATEVAQAIPYGYTNIFLPKHLRSRGWRGISCLLRVLAAFGRHDIDYRFSVAHCFGSCFYSFSNVRLLLPTHLVYIAH